MRFDFYVWSSSSVILKHVRVQIGRKCVLRSNCGAISTSDTQCAEDNGRLILPRVATATAFIRLGFDDKLHLTHGFD